CLDEGTDRFRVFHARRALNAGRDINARRGGGRNRARHVLYVQSAGEEPWLVDCPLTEQCPIEGTAAAASLRASGRFRIEKKDIGHGLITRQHVEIASVGNAD